MSKRPSKKTTLYLLAFIMVVNALSYGTIIPLLFPYAQRFGVTAFGMSLLFICYSAAQFFATPILGRISDKYGRKPVLLFCLLGTSISLGVFAMARTAAMLFVARFIDGITGGNISVAQAIISDSTSGKERAKSFGLLNAAFGFGFLFGPVLGGLVSRINLTAPFWFSAVLALVAVILGMVILPETLNPKNATKKHDPLFKFQAILHALFSPAIGIILLISFFTAASMNGMIVGFQVYTVTDLKLSALQTGIFFTVIGLIGILMQVFGIQAILKLFPSKNRALVVSTVLSMLGMVGAYFANSIWLFSLSMIFFALVAAFRDPITAAILSERTKAEDQGGVMGINMAYVSLGQVVGPLTAGLVATAFSVRTVFLLAAIYLVFASFATHWLYAKDTRKLDL